MIPEFPIHYRYISGSEQVWRYESHAYRQQKMLGTPSKVPSSASRSRFRFQSLLREGQRIPCPPPQPLIVVLQHQQQRPRFAVRQEVWGKIRKGNGGVSLELTSEQWEKLRRLSLPYVSLLVPLLILLGADKK